MTSENHKIRSMKISEQLLSEFEPQSTWLAHDSYYHGIGHMSRVLILQELISNLLEQNGAMVNRTALRWAAAAHDVGRVDDGLDLEHGTRSAEWIKRNLADRMTPEELDIATYIVHWHTPSDHLAPDMTIELQILKDADALDRVRLGDLDPTYLRTDVAKNLVDTAQQLYDASRPQDLNQKETFEDVINAAVKLGIVTK